MEKGDRKFIVLLTGSSGWLGQFVCRELSQPEWSDKVELYAGYNSVVPEWIAENRRVVVNLRDPTAVDELIDTLRPDAVIHLAALSSPAVCEKNLEDAMHVNCPLALAEALQKYAPKCALIFSSTDLVYDGENPPYAPPQPGDAVPRPETAYGKSKLAFENEVLALEKGVVLRLSNMIGPAFSYRHAGSKFVQWLCETYHRREPVSLRFDEIRSFVYVSDVVNIILRSIAAAIGGDASPIFGRVFNVGGPDGLSRLDLAALVAKVDKNELVVAHSSHEAVEAASSDTSARKAWHVSRSSNADSVRATGIHNPRDVTMDSSETERIFGIKFKSVVEVLNIVVPTMLLALEANRP
jgi:dTDP-4-dehydrorhamnose reductase